MFKMVATGNVQAHSRTENKVNFNISKYIFMRE